MKVVFRVDAGPKIGFGHIKRCIVLANILTKLGAEIHFICCESIGDFSNQIKMCNFLLTLIPQFKNDEGNWKIATEFSDHDMKQSIKAIRNWSSEVDWLIVDHYFLSEKWENSLSIWVNNICVIDDFVNRSHKSDILINQSRLGSEKDLYNGLVPSKCRVLIGEKYVLLDEKYSFLIKENRRNRRDVKKVLIFFGASDSVNLTEKIMKLIVQLVEIGLIKNNIVFNVVTTSANTNNGLIKKLSSRYKYFNFYLDLPNLVSLMVEADLAIGGGGSTSWERLCLGLPTLVITLSENQVELAKMLEKKNLIKLVGHYSNFNEDYFKNILAEVLNSGVRMLDLKQDRKLVDGLGAARCAAIIINEAKEVSIRDVMPKDEAMILSLANDPLSRNNSFKTEIISHETHARVFKTWLSEREIVKIFILEDAYKELIGQTRFEYEDPYWKIDYTVAPGFRGLGYGKTLLKLGIRRVLNQYGNTKLLAEVKRANEPSRKILTELGFSVLRSTKDLIAYSFEPDIN